MRCFGRENKMVEHFTRFARKKRRTISEKHSKNSKNTTRRTTSAILRIFEELNNPLSPHLGDKQAIEDELNVNGSKHVLAFKLGIILN